MIVLFHALFLVTRHYFCFVISQSLFSFQHELPKKCQRNVLDNLIWKNANVVSQSDFNDGNLKFFPPVYVQRYLTVKGILEDKRWKDNIKKIVDFGCGEFGLFPYIKYVQRLQEILAVDIDESLLHHYKFRLTPCNFDYCGRIRNEPLVIHVLAGNIAYRDQCLLGCDAVICIELIEHLYPETLEDVPYTVFGFIKPLIAIFTTPNSEFNVLFNLTGFRHTDHKFEWDRAQFECWANNIVTRYPDYWVQFQNIGPGPAGTEHLGSCSQLALFIRNSDQTSHVITPNSKQELDISKATLNCGNYTSIQKVNYPFLIDDRTLEEKILNTSEYYMHLFSTAEQFTFEGRVEVPLTVLSSNVCEWTDSLSTLQKILEDAGWQTIEREPGNVSVVFPLEEDSTESNTEDLEPQELCVNDSKCISRDYNWDVVLQRDSDDSWDGDFCLPTMQNQEFSDSLQCPQGECSAEYTCQSCTASNGVQDSDSAQSIKLDSVIYACTTSKGTSPFYLQTNTRHQGSFSSDSALEQEKHSSLPLLKNENNTTAEHMELVESGLTHSKNIDTISDNVEKCLVAHSPILPDQMNLISVPLQDSLKSPEIVKGIETVLVSNTNTELGAQIPFSTGVDTMPTVSNTLKSNETIDSFTHRASSQVVCQPGQVKESLPVVVRTSGLHLNRLTDDSRKSSPAVVGLARETSTQVLFQPDGVKEKEIVKEKLIVKENLIPATSQNPSSTSSGSALEPLVYVPCQSEGVKDSSSIVTRREGLKPELSLDRLTDSNQRFSSSVSSLTVECSMQVLCHSDGIKDSSPAPVRKEGPKPADLLLDRLTDSPMVDSYSLDEQNDKLADSGYPNSASAQDMELDLTPEQVEEIFTENDVLTEDSSFDNNNSDSLSVSSGDSDNMDNDGRHFRPIFPHRNEMLFEAMNVENGDVANNNRDGEGNNVIAVVNPVVEARDIVEELFPLLAAAEDFDNDNEYDLMVPENAQPFPQWLLHLLGLVNQGAADMNQFLQPPDGLFEYEDVEEEDSSDDEVVDAVRRTSRLSIIDEGLGEEFHSDNSRDNSNASERRSNGELEELLVLDLVEEEPRAVMGGGGEPNIFRDDKL